MSQRAWLSNIILNLTTFLQISRTGKVFFQFVGIAERKISAFSILSAKSSFCAGCVRGKNETLRSLIRLHVGKWWMLHLGWWRGIIRLTPSTVVSLVQNDSFSCKSSQRELANGDHERQSAANTSYREWQMRGSSAVTMIMTMMMMTLWSLSEWVNHVLASSTPASNNNIPLVRRLMIHLGQFIRPQQTALSDSLGKALRRISWSR